MECLVLGSGLGSSTNFPFLKLPKSSNFQYSWYYQLQIQKCYAQIHNKMTQIRMILLDSAPVLALGAETYARASPENQGA